MTIYGPEVDWKWTGSGPVCPSVRLSALPLPPYARDLQAQGACALRFLKSRKDKLLSDVILNINTKFASTVVFSQYLH